ncbi:tetratricopeptide repeat protein [Thermospira aquatica]|uniref:Tetratricopeptide repeat protein n=1 Tax=Thermospira aquatica TaxID=2828656 RepID=A0AAX3BB76_9SPIR|nr:tetratricopeptide repeat protein [Thermospira aquatica]URA09331.1 tetratricopeptide repeat protein [Thermospira aquatica]
MAMIDVLSLWILATVVLLLAGVVAWSFWAVFLSQTIEHRVQKLYKKGEYQECIRLISDRLEKNENISHKERLFLLYYLARSYESLNQVVSALQFYQEASRVAGPKHPLYHDLLLAVVNLYQRQQNYKEALAYAMMVLQQKEDHPYALLKAAECQYALHHNKKARELLEKLLKKRPGVLDGRFLYGKILYETGHAAFALKEWELLIRYHYQEGRVWFYYARCLENVRKYFDALSAYETFLKQYASGYPEERYKSWQAVIQIWIKLKEYHKGIQYVSEYLAQPAPEDIKKELLYLYANLLWNTGEEYQSLKNIERIYMMDPQFRDVKVTYEMYKKLLPHSYLSQYFTSREDVFLSVCKRLLGRTPFQEVVVNADVAIYGKGSFYVVFWRHIEAISHSKLTDMMVLLTSSENLPSSVEMYSLMGVREDAVLHELLKKSHLVEGQEFIQAVKEVVG